MHNSKQATQRLVEDYTRRGDPNGWFEEFYARAGGDIHQIYWADLEYNPMLIDWIRGKAAPPAGTQAITIGCGLGDDAEALAQHGYQVTAFDISPSAIDMCRQRYPDSVVDYRVADLFDHPAAWRRGFDLVYECNTIQILSGQSRVRALKAIAELAAPEGEVLVSCRSRRNGDNSDQFPVALDRDEINGFRRAGLSEIRFAAYDDNQKPPVPHFFAVYKRPA
jgi:predicted TPR repeat methyltransferase